MLFSKLFYREIKIYLLQQKRLINSRYKSAVPALPQKLELLVPEVEIPEKPKSLIKRCFTAINKYFDLDLLRDPVYVSIMLGMSLAIFAEFNFSTLTPFILKDMHLENNDIATVMSSVATTDLLLRAVSPYIGEFLRKSPRMMYLFSLFLLIITRTGNFTYLPIYTRVRLSVQSF